MLTQSLTVSFAFETWPVYREDMRIAALTKGMQNPVIFLFRPPFLVLAIVNSDTHSVRHSFSFILSFFFIFSLCPTQKKFAAFKMRCSVVLRAECGDFIGSVRILSDVNESVWRHSRCLLFVIAWHDGCEAAAERGAKTHICPRATVLLPQCLTRYSHRMP